MSTNVIANLARERHSILSGTRLKEVNTGLRTACAEVIRTRIPKSEDDDICMTPRYIRMYLEAHLAILTEDNDWHGFDFSGGELGLNQMEVCLRNDKMTEEPIQVAETTEYLQTAIDELMRDTRSTLQLVQITTDMNGKLYRCRFRLP